MPTKDTTVLKLPGAIETPHVKPVELGRLHRVAWCREAGGDEPRPYSTKGAVVKRCGDSGRLGGLHRVAWRSEAGGDEPHPQGTGSTRRTREAPRTSLH